MAAAQSLPVRRHRSKLILLLVTIAWTGLLWLLVSFHQDLVDWWRLRNYTAPAAVAQIATQDTMTSHARRVFYVNHPAIESKSQFKQCPAGDEKTIVLGCYISDQRGIYVLSVSDSRLDGVEQVTAAHEMLHAAYDRLSGSERTRVNAMLQDYYDHQLSDQRIKDTIAEYRKSEPGQVVNEMHSIFGTEIANLPAPLEQYYKQYFTNRQAVTTYAHDYESEFTSREDAVKTYDAQITSLLGQVKADDTTLATQKAQIGPLQASVTNQNSALQTQQAQLNAAKQRGDYASYNAGVASYNAGVEKYDADIDQLQSLIDTYNQLVTARNNLVTQAQQIEKTRKSVALEAQQLTDEIDSTVAPIQQK